MRPKLGRVTLCKHAGHIAQPEALMIEQHQNVVEEVGSFIKDCVPLAGDRGQGKFDSFFTNFLGNALGAGSQ